VGNGVGSGVGGGVGNGDGSGDGTGVGYRVGSGVGTGLGAGVGSGVGRGVGASVHSKNKLKSPYAEAPVPSKITQYSPLKNGERGENIDSGDFKREGDSRVCVRFECF
jgi:hypothetical protein